MARDAGDDVGTDDRREAADLRYSAFISYNHKDRRWASWLHRKLEGYRIPKALQGRDTSLGPLGPKLPPVFQDQAELAASSDLAQSVRDALAQSASLIVICSPNSARSRWVNEEIREFTRLGGRDRIHLLVVDGVPGTWSESSAEDRSFPPALFENGETEPLAADARPEGDGKQAAFLKIAASLLGVGLDELRRRELHRRNRRLAIVAAASLTGLAVMTVLSVFAVISRFEAIEQRDLARRQTATAERTAEFVQSLFEVSDPSEAKGNELTARQMLDTGARRIEGALGTEPTVKAQLMTTLSRVYMGLGSFKKADAIIRQSMALNIESAPIRARQLIALAESQARQGKYPTAKRQYDAALVIAQAMAGTDTRPMADALVGRGETLSALGDYTRADADIRKARGLYRREAGPGSPLVANGLEALGYNLIAAGKPNHARPLFDRAIAIRVASQGLGHPKVAEDLNELGTIAYLQRDAARAEALWLRTLKSDQLVLGPDHPDVAATLNNVARVQLEQRKFRAARAMLRRAIAMVRAQQTDTYDDLAFTYGNLALVERGLGNLAEAERWFRMGLDVAEMHGHRNLAPILVDLADVRCRRGDHGEGLRLLARAAPIMEADYPDDAWRQGWLENTQGACLLISGERARGRAAIAGSMMAIRERWPANSLYRSIANERARDSGLR